MQRKHEEMIQSNPAIMMGKPVMAGTRDQEIVFRQKRTSCGVLLLRLAGLSARSKADIVGITIKKYRNELLNNFSVVSPMNVRIRSSTQPA